MASEASGSGPTWRTAQQVRVIFLDIDGVLNSQRYQREWQARGLSATDWPSAEYVDPRAVACLNQIITATGAVIVVSSSWRYSMSASELSEFLSEQGVRARVVATTPRSQHRHRGREIARWLEAQVAVSGFVILDDRDDLDPYMARLVQTSADEGLVEAHVAPAIGHLFTAVAAAP